MFETNRPSKYERRVAALRNYCRPRMASSALKLGDTGPSGNVGILRNCGDSACQAFPDSGTCLCCSKAIEFFGEDAGPRFIVEPEAL